MEHVEMKTNTLRVTLIPAAGGKIASLVAVRQNAELLQQPLLPYAARTMTMGFEESDASGFDECLPSVSACEVETPGGRVAIPDHGDFWRIPWAWEKNGDELRLWATGRSLPLHFERLLRLEDDILHIHYSVRNEGDFAVEYAWSAHPLFAVDEGDRILLPPSVKKAIVENSGGNRLGAQGVMHDWPRTQLRDGAPVDLSLAGSMADGVGDKLFATAPAEGWAALERMRHGVRVEVRFDAAQLPVLGLWLCYGGWPEGRVNRQYCVAIEPCTAAADSLAAAAKKGQARKLLPGESEEWEMQICISDVSRTSRQV
ncbi:DUF4432 family protein [Paracidobacterium acidisoli]|nr:DUF4432 family protein [Paracidobacterium acidisoli]MBT9331728.1 DUF4432 family protein [Paracidobacterium acidisoli]